MLPAKQKKIDISSLTEEERKLFMLYGKLPTHKNVLTKMQKERKYFDSGDYALSKAGVAPQNSVGTAIPNPENIPHATSPPTGHQQPLSISPTNHGISASSPSPIKESSFTSGAEGTSMEGTEPSPLAAETDTSE